MAQTTFEQAKACPRCGDAGEVTKTENGPKGSKVHTVYCRNERCRWFDTAWVVQVQRDGSIPMRKKGDKDFPAIPSWAENAGRRMVELVQHEVEQGEITSDR